MEYNRSARQIDYEAKARYDAADRTAREICHRLTERARRGCLDRDETYNSLKRIVLTKYLLEPEDATSDYFNALGEISIAKVLGTSVEEARGRDLEAKCNGTSSVMTKKILLMIFLQRELPIVIDDTTAVEMLTIAELADFIYSQMV